MVKLDTPEKIAQAIKDIRYRLNSMMANELYDFLYRKYQRDIYRASHLLEPSYEISIVFGRQLLDFLQIGYNNKKGQLDDPLVFKSKNIKEDDLFLSSFPNIQQLPFNDQLTSEYSRQIQSIIKVANKASAHMTFSHTTESEFADIAEVKQVIFDLCVKYVPDLDHKTLWWEMRHSL